MPHHLIQLPFDAGFFGPRSAGKICVSSAKVSAMVDLATGAIDPRSGGCERPPPKEISEALAGLTECFSETNEGPRTALRDEDGNLLSTFAGALSAAARRGDLFVGLVKMPGRRIDAIGLLFGNDVSPMRLPAGSSSSVVVGEGLGAVACDGLLHAFLHTTVGLQSVSMGLPSPPPTGTYEMFFAGAVLWVLARGSLIGVDTAELPFDTLHRSIALSCVPLVAAGFPEDEPAKVLFASPQYVLVDHPRLGRLRLPQGPAAPSVKSGDKIVLDDVREKLPGIFEVRAWHRADEEASLYMPGSSTLELPAPVVETQTAEAAGEPATMPKTLRGSSDSERIGNLAERHGFKIPPMLLELLLLRERDPVFLRWLDLLGFDMIEVRGLNQDWDADPCLLAFAGLGNGDEYCLYIYPPILESGQEPPVVEFLHETGEVLFRAESFESFFAAELAERETWEDGNDVVVARIRKKLGMDSHIDVGAATTKLSAEPPEWLAAIARESTVEEALRLVEDGNCLAGERALLSIYIGGSDEWERARDELERLYQRLEWTLPLEHLHEVY